VDEVGRLIDFRLKQAGYKGEEPLFSPSAIMMLWKHTQGYPRKLALMCHNALETLVMYDRKIVDEEIVAWLIESEIKPVVRN